MAGMEVAPGQEVVRCLVLGWAESRGALMGAESGPCYFLADWPGAKPDP